MRSESCPHCGVEPVGDDDCRRLFDSLLSRKFKRNAPQYALANACYTLQHAAVTSDGGLAFAHLLLHKAVVDGADLAAAREAAYEEFDLFEGRFERFALPSVWSMTVADLKDVPEDDDSARILAWAHAVRADLEKAAS
jgi:hypothetical protein